MYSQFYLEKNSNFLEGTGIDYCENFKETFENILDMLDKYIYLAQMFQILKSCSEDFLSFKETNKNDFWKINKYLLGYVNAVYCYKEHVSHYNNRDAKLNMIQDEFYCSMGKYRFICEYRNRIIHQSARIKDVDIYTGDFYIDLQDLVSYFESLITEKNNPKQMSKNKKTREYIQHLQAYGDSCILFDNRPYLSAKSIVLEANKEIEAMNEKICLHIWNTDIKKCFEWIYEKLYYNNSTFKTTFAVKDNDFSTSINLTYVFEEYFVLILMSLGYKSNVIEEMQKYYESKSYNYFINYERSINDLIQGVKLLIDEQ